MTEKRFTIESIMMREGIIDNTDGEQLDAFDCIKRLCEVSNELAEENRRLKIQLDDVTNESIGYEEQIEKLLKKNEQLKKENKTLANGLTAYFENKRG